MVYAALTVLATEAGWEICQNKPHLYNGLGNVRYLLTPKTRKSKLRRPEEGI
jgi:hypothetical protein